MSTTTSSTLVDPLPSQETFRRDVIAGLSCQRKHLPSKYFYDERGSQLFDQICDLDEYYVTRTEIGIMEQHAKSMTDRLGKDTLLVELGSGSSIKTRLLLEYLPPPATYIPVDISREHLHASAERLRTAFPNICVKPVCADFTQEFEIPAPEDSAGSVSVYFPGSTIGNFQQDEATELLAQIARLIAPTNGGMLIGIDLRKDHGTLHAAYNDREGVTAEFNLNLLRRINLELDGDFDLEGFQHLALYNPRAGRMELFLESRTWQTVSIGNETFDFRLGERIRTEYSHKYTIEGFRTIAENVGFELQDFWTDPDQYFAVLYFRICAKTS